MLLFPRTMGGRGSFVCLVFVLLALGGCQGTGDRPPISGDYFPTREDAGARPEPDAAVVVQPTRCSGEVAFPAGYTDLCVGGPIFDRLVLREDVDYFSERRTTASGIEVVEERGSACASARDPDRCRVLLARALPGGAAYLGVTFYAATSGDDVVAASLPSPFLENGISLENDVTIQGRVLPCGDGLWWGARRASADGALHWFNYDVAQRVGTRWSKDPLSNGSPGRLVPELDDAGACVLRPAGALDDP